MNMEFAHSKMGWGERDREKQRKRIKDGKQVGPSPGSGTLTPFTT